MTPVPAIAVSFPIGLSARLDVHRQDIALGHIDAIGDHIRATVAQRSGQLKYFLSASELTNILAGDAQPVKWHSAIDYADCPGTCFRSSHTVFDARKPNVDAAQRDARITGHSRSALQ